MKSLRLMITVALTGICMTTQGMQQQNIQPLPQRTVLLQLITLQPRSIGKLTKNNHIPVVMHISRSTTPTEIQDTIIREFSISPTHHVELLDQDHMKAEDAEKYFTKPTGHLTAPSDSPLCLIAQECPSPKTPLKL